jgi:putative GTP pyrophosphokinase
MKIYTLAMEEIEKRVNSINDDYKDIFKEELINHVISRIKTSDSINKKMKRKKYELTYKNLIEYINDIAGVRVVCPYKANVFEVVEIIKEFENCRIIREKDYITHPKETGYSSYHIIIEVPVELNGIKLYTPVEIQIRTMAMDFWATLEHEIKYKSNGKISDKVSKELVAYSKIINKIDNRLMKLHNKKYKGNIRLS